MAKFKDVQAQDTTFKCDSCKETFKAAHVLLEEAADNIEILTPIMSFIYVDKNGKIMGGSQQPSKEKGDKIFTCPYCKTAHPFGFDKVE